MNLVIKKCFQQLLIMDIFPLPWQPSFLFALHQAAVTEVRQRLVSDTVDRTLAAEKKKADASAAAAATEMPTAKIRKITELAVAKMKQETEESDREREIKR